MREKALTLAFLMIVSALAGCVTEDRFRDDSDSSDLEDGSYVEDPIDSDADGLSDLEEQQHGTEWLLWDTDGDGVSDGWEIYHGYDPLNGSDGAPRALCEWNEADWIEASDRGVEAYCHYSDEWYEELCEQRNGTWIESSDRLRESYCDLDDNQDDDREITQEDCERRGGTWFEERSLCYFEQEHVDYREERLIHQMSVVYPDNSSELMFCRGCINLENMTGWDLTTTALSERNISMNYSTHEVYGHSVSGINGSDSPSDWSWYWTLYVWNETDAANASWEVSAVGIDSVIIRNHTGHIAWAPNSTNISDIPVPRVVVENTEGDSEMTQEDCERRGGTWTEASNREGEFYCDYGDNDAPCDENMTCGDAITCVDGFLYPTTCGDTNCDEPIGRCGAYASIIVVQSAWNGDHPNYSGLNDIFNSTQPIEIFGYLDENSIMEKATNEEARNYAEQYGINFSFTPLVGNEHGINSSDIEGLPYYAVSFSMSCDNIIENQMYDDFVDYNGMIDFIDTWIDCTRSNGSENSQETES